MKKGFKGVLIGLMMAAMLCVAPLVVMAADSGGYGGGSSAPAAKPADSGGYGGSSAPAATAAAPAAKKDAAAPAAVKKEAAAPVAAKKEAAPVAAKKEAAAPAAATPAAAAPEAAPTAVAAAEPVAAPAPAPAPEAPAMPSVSLGFILSGLLIGGAIGWILQRGRFCMNSAFRDVIFIEDHTFMRAYVLALVIAIVGANVLNDMGAVKLMPQPFWFVADIVGGLIFGLGIVLAGGCGSGIWYRVGEGQVAAGVAVFGFFLGISSMSHGMFQPIYKALRGIRILGVNTTNADGDAVTLAPTLFNIIDPHSMTVKWAVIAVVVIAGLIYVWKGEPFAYTKSKGYFWSVTGAALGVVAIIAFWASQYFGGVSSGLTFTTPSRDLFLAITTASAQPQPPFKGYQLFNLVLTWPIFFIIGVPLGAALSAKLLNEFVIKGPNAKELLTVFGGSLMMGVGAQLAGGCNMGQGITGVASLSIGSIVATLAIIGGNWIMVYYKFIKPMQDMDD